MRFELQFVVGKNEFTRDYRRVIISFLKHALSSARDGKYYGDYYKDTNKKDFSFATIFDRPKYEKDKIVLQSGQMKVLFSCDDQNRTGLLFMNAFIAQKNKVFKLPGGNSMVLKKVEQKRDILITNGKVLFKTTAGAGLCCRVHDEKTNRDTHLIFSDDDFQQQMQKIMRVQVLSAGFSQKLADNIRLNPIRMKKVVVLHYGVLVDVSVGLLEIEADPSVLQYFYQAGVGSRHSAGFGKLDLISQELL